MIVDSGVCSECSKVVAWFDALRAQSCEHEQDAAKSLKLAQRGPMTRITESSQRYRDLALSLRVDAPRG